TAAAERTARTDPGAAATMSAAAADLRRWMRELRSLVVTITPPALHAQGLRASLTDLAGTLETRGMTVDVDVTGTDDLDEATEALTYRAAQEAVRNIVRHANASRVQLQVDRPSPGELQLVVRDDGRGLPKQSGPARRRGSVGLELLGRLVSSQGGTLQLRDADGGGAELRLNLPVANDARRAAAGSSH
ncbi:MAG: hypothetical protein JWN77_1187, partial [Frankiales bacterium]|nr:hypothetical protein [Frankiales bacterium]